MSFNAANVSAKEYCVSPEGSVGGWEMSVWICKLRIDREINAVSYTKTTSSQG